MTLARFGLSGAQASGVQNTVRLRERRPVERRQILRHDEEMSAAQ
jgi:hypothetical protein